MKYRRKPVARDVVDALKGDTVYMVQGTNGTIGEVSIAEFERDYEPVKRERIAKPKRAKKAKEAE